MFVLNKNSEALNKLIGYLQDANPKFRTVVYYAIAEYTVPQLLKDIEISRLINKDISVIQQIKDFIYKLNEVAIVDKTLLERIFTNVLEYKLHSLTCYKNVSYDLLSANCFQDILGLTRYYTADDIHTINTHFDLFKRVVATVVELVKESNTILNKVQE